jgi:hypothetical protein
VTAGERGVMVPDRRCGAPRIASRSGWKGPRYQKGFAWLTNPFRFGGPFLCDAADFDGTNDYMTRGQLSGMSDSKTGIFSVWALKDTTTTDIYVLMASEETTGWHAIQAQLFSPTGELNLTMSYNGGQATRINTSGAGMTTGNWYHVLCRWDNATGTSALQCYINDVDQTLINQVSANQNVYWTGVSTWRVGNQWFGGADYDGGLAELYLAPGQLLDFDTESNRRKFISSSGKPVNLGSDGSTPTGSAPKIYLHLDDGESAANFATNRAGTGDFTVTGSLSTRGSSPSD